MHGMHTLCRDPRPVPRRWGPCIWHMASVSIASDAAADASGVMAATKNLPVFRRLRVLVRATVDLAIVEQARRQRRRRLGSPAEVATVVSERTARVLAAEGNSLVAGGRVGAIAEVWVLHTSGSSLREGGGRTYDGDVVRLDEFVVVVVASAERRGGGRGRRPGRGTGHGGRLAVPGDDRPLNFQTDPPKWFGGEGCTSSCRHETNKGSSSPKFCAEHGPQFSSASARCSPAGGLPGHGAQADGGAHARPHHWTAEALDSGHWDNAGDGPANGTRTRATCAELAGLGALACLRFQWGEGRIQPFSDQKTTEPDPRFHHRDPGTLVIVPPHSVCSQKVAFSTKYLGCPCQLQANYCEQLAMEHPFFVWEDGVLFSRRTADALFRSGLPPLPSASPSPVTSIAVHGDTLYGTHPTTLIPRRPSTAPQATRSPKVV